MIPKEKEKGKAKERKVEKSRGSTRSTSNQAPNLGAKETKGTKAPRVVDPATGHRTGPFNHQPGYLIVGAFTSSIPAKGIVEDHTHAP